MDLHWKCGKQVISYTNKFWEATKGEGKEKPRLEKIILILGMHAILCLQLEGKLNTSEMEL